MAPGRDAFHRSVLEQIALNRARTPTERMLALCDLLDAARALAPRGAEARARRRRSQALRQQQREQLRAEFRRLLATRRSDAASGV